MANTVRTQYHRPLPHGGRVLGGSPNQVKVEVRGRITVTSYLQTGESLTPDDLGLTVIDWLDIKHENEAGGKEGSEPRDIRYNYSDQQFYILETGKPANAGTHYLSFNAFGDSARGPELL